MPVGGGGAWPGFEIDHSEPSGARVAISRAGRRPRAHKAARPGADARATGINLAGHGQALTWRGTDTQRGRDRFPGHGLVDE